MEEKSLLEEERKEEAGLLFRLNQATKNNMLENINKKGVTFIGNTFFYT